MSPTVVNLSHSPVDVGLATGSFRRAAIGLAGGVGASFCILLLLAQAQRATASGDRLPAEELQEVVFPPPPPPPPARRPLEPASLAAEMPLLPTPDPSPDAIRVPIALPAVIRPPANARMDFDFSPEAFRPQSDGEGGDDALRIFTRNEVDQQAVAVYKETPSVNARLLKNQEQRVVLLFIVGIDGSVAGIQVLKSVSPEVDRSVIQAIANWQFRAARRKGRVVRQWVQLPVVLRVGDGNPFVRE